MKLPFNLKFNTALSFLKDYLSFVLLAFLVLVAITVYFKIYGEWRKVSESKGDSSIPGQIVRVNLDAHKELEKKLNDNATFEPKNIDGADAFSSPGEIAE